MKDLWPALLILAGAALASGAGWSAEIPGQISVSLPAAGQGAPSEPIKLKPSEPGAIDRSSQKPIESSICAVGVTPCRSPVTTDKQKIVGGGRPATDFQYGFVIAIYYKGPDGATYICSGTLLTSTLILTAGHCGCGVPGTYWVDVHQDAHQPLPSDLHYIDGRPNLYDQSVCRDGNLSEGNDLALLRLRDAVDLTAQTEIHPDPTFWNGYGYPTEFVWDLRTKLTRGNQLVAVGYGYTSQHVLGVRMQANIPIFSFDCEEAALAFICAPFAEMVLSEAPGGGRQRTDTCGGDSGGPVFRTENGRPRLVAVTSRAAPGLQDDPALHCGGGGIYTLIGRKSVQRWLAANGVPPQSGASHGPQ